ncbi:transcriptional regulator [Bombiscardovia apis]|uniref:Transcriptional regulator n=1 Tax=Bombiscardovia apis TaxID=2932182 RepID=A0ABN6SCY7_9BIFI|nr:MerR family transcriptional regulator [Bombiscardovia apis]BDR53955.1 transcriptional regulator [Bombiscardovia apis]
MKLAELSRESGVSAASIKYYLRLGLLPAGEKVSARVSEYSPAHLKRLRLITNLVHVVGLSIAQTEQVLSSIDQADLSLEGAIEQATVALPSATASEQAEDSRCRLRCKRAEASDRKQLAAITEELKDCGFDDVPDLEYVRHLERAILAAREAGLAVDQQMLAKYSAAARTLASIDFEHIPTDDRDNAIDISILGTVMLEPIILGLRRLAHRELIAHGLPNYKSE